jgi:GMP reductase
MRIINEIKLDFCDVLIQPKRSQAIISRAGVDLIRKYKFLNSTSEWEGTPIIAANMDSTGTVAMSKALAKHNMMTALQKYYSVPELIFFYDTFLGLSRDVFYTLGVRNDDFDKSISVRSKIKYEIPCYCVDAACGYTDFFVSRVAKLREMVGNEPIIMAGNVATPEMVQELLLVGKADIVKIGIGPGSVCKTRRITGCGYPQLSAVIECADVAHGLGGHICADGGCREPGDVVKAFAGGADFVMLGGMLAGTDECEGEWRYWEHKPEQKKAFVFYGMSSVEANDKYNGGLKDYRAAEGSCQFVPYKGPVDRVIQEVTGGLRSACAYVGADKLKDLTKCATFIRVNRVHSGD